MVELEPITITLVETSPLPNTGDGDEATLNGANRDGRKYRPARTLRHISRSSKTHFVSVGLRTVDAVDSVDTVDFVDNVDTVDT